MRDVISFIFQMRKPRLRGIKYLIQGHFVSKKHHEFEQTLGDSGPWESQSWAWLGDWTITISLLSRTSLSLWRTILFPSHNRTLCLFWSHFSIKWSAHLIILGAPPRQWPWLMLCILWPLIVLGTEWASNKYLSMTWLTAICGWRWE